MKKIKLSKGKFAIVDDKDFERLSKKKWHYTLYARRSVVENGKRKSSLMQWEVLGKPRKGLQVDHVNGDKLDNRRKNLRIATPSQNRVNSVKPKNNTSGYKGVIWNRICKKWIAKTSFNKKLIFLGYFTSKLDAYKAYCEACVKYHKEYARVK